MSQGEKEVIGGFAQPADQDIQTTTPQQTQAMRPYAQTLVEQLNVAKAECVLSEQDQKKRLDQMYGNLIESKTIIVDVQKIAAERQKENNMQQTQPGTVVGKAVVSQHNKDDKQSFVENIADKAKDVTDAVKDKVNHVQDKVAGKVIGLFKGEKDHQEKNVEPNAKANPLAFMKISDSNTFSATTITSGQSQNNGKGI